MSRYDAVLFDAFGTLIELDRPFDRLREVVRDRLGVDVNPQDAERAFRQEMAYYAEHCHLGRDDDSVAALRLRCAELLVAELALDAPAGRLVDTLADAIVYRVYDDVQPTLDWLRERGTAVAVVSNWDCTLPDVLASAGIDIPTVVDSATAGAPKPDPRIFREALARLGVESSRALHVGDTPDADGEGARAAGIDVRLIERNGSGGESAIRSLTDVLELVG
jgi:putative hydrolase of the HAD superfamily